MADTSTFRGTLDFLADIGVYDVILPFLLVFTIVFALLEKTRVFGTEKVGDAEYSKKHLNSLASFVIAFFVIASSRLVEIVTQISANVVVLLLAGVFFLLLAGSFHQQKPEGFFLEGRFKTLFMSLMFVGLVFIFLNAIEAKNKTWLQWLFDWLRQFTDNVSVSAVVLIILVVGIMYYIGAIGPSKEETSNNKK
ncbi:hypothetical protein CMO88_00630 [Candidatus Woesearchaeota archaeon]|nr:hypothetical protein [Candidatus Woesearchaeota archaeon]|tara:strand:- start:10699 stop:11280 length:582 start_codon:yes stop_codon:yes gene_type:complete